MNISFDAIANSCKTIGDLQRLEEEARNCPILNRIIRESKKTIDSECPFAEKLVEELG